MKHPITKTEMEYRSAKRETHVLGKAEKAVYERPDSYGDPEDSFSRIASMWSGYLDTEVTASDVANLMVMLKVARNAEGQYHEDSWIDIAGYAECGARLEKNE